jgi:hypothetical protein
MEKLTKVEEQILKAQPTEEPSRSKLVWKAKRKWKLTATRLKLKQKTRFHPSTENARVLLEQSGRDLNFCDSCGSEGKVQIHHIDLNPYNNRLENLQALCKDCHMKLHGLDGSEILSEDFGVRRDRER